MLLPNFIQLNLNEPNPLKIIRKPADKEEMKHKQYALKGVINQNKTNIRQEKDTPDDDSQTIFLHVTKCIVPQRKTKKNQYVISKTKLKFKKEENQQKQSQNNQRANNVQINKYKYLKKKQHAKGGQQNNFTHHNSQTVQPSKNKDHTQREMKRAKHNSTQMSIKQKKKQSVKELGKDEVTMKLNLGQKKNKDKDKMREYYRNLLERTKIDDIIPIKRGPYQPSPPAYNQVSSLSKQKKEGLANDQQNKNIKTQKRLVQNKKINKIPNCNRNKKSEIVLPNLHQYRNIVEMVKNDERKRNKKLFYDDYQDNLPSILLPKLTNQGESKQKQTNNIQNSIIIEQEIQYNSIHRQKQQKQCQVIHQSIQQSIHIQKN